MLYNAVGEPRVPETPAQIKEAEESLSRYSYASGEAGKKTAIEELTKLCIRWPDLARAWHLIGTYYTELEQYEPAVQSLQKAGELDPKRTEFALSLAKTLLMAADKRAGGTTLVSAILLDPELVSRQALEDCKLTLFKRALRTADAQPDWPQEYIVAYQRALLKVPDSAPAHYSLGRVLAACGSDDEAIVEFETALRLRPDYPECLVSQGRSYLATNKHKEAAACFKKTAGKSWAERHEPLSVVLAGRSNEVVPAHALLGLATAYMQLGDYNLAYSTARTASEVAAEAFVDEYDADDEARRVWDEYRSACQSFGERCFEAKDYVTATAVYNHMTHLWTNIGLDDYNGDSVVNDFIYLATAACASGIRASSSGERKQYLNLSAAALDEVSNAIAEFNLGSHWLTQIEELRATVAQWQF